MKLLRQGPCLGVKKALFQMAHLFSTFEHFLKIPEISQLKRRNLPAPDGPFDFFPNIPKYEIFE